MPWAQVYNPLAIWWLSTLLAALPIIVLLGGLAFLRLKAHLAALAGLFTSWLVSLLVFKMPADKAFLSAGFGAAYGLFPIGWIILNAIYLYELCQEKGAIQVLRENMSGITSDCRLQLLLISFCFGAFFESAAGFGTPVAITAALLIGLGFPPLQASGLSLIANTAPVAYGALGTPIVALAGVTGLDLYQLSAMVGRQLPFFSVIVPFWLVAVFCGFKKTAEIWPAALVAGLSFAIPQALISNFHGPWLAGVASSLVSLSALIIFLRFWRPKQAYYPEDFGQAEIKKENINSRALISAAAPWLILSLVIFIWGIPQFKKLLDSILAPAIAIPGLHQQVLRMPPVSQAPAAEAAIFRFNFLSFTGTGILVAAIISGLMMRFSFRNMIVIYWKTLKRVRFSLLTVSAMLALGYITRYSGMDATLGLAFARTGLLYPFFGTLLGWLGVALTGSDTSSNVLFGSLQKITAGQLGLSPVLMAAANSSGGVMGKMIDAQSIVVASTATRWYGHEGHILRYVFWHSLILTALVALLVFLQAYVYPFNKLTIP
ncbi:MAG: L-lactate permease [Candidatus Saccharicenans sp.]|uniref:L-lactate permease n=1 Tax=Candidatus Saccharicenans sp. TaxID=2819258 RepID=UPI00404B9AA2